MMHQLIRMRPRSLFLIFLAVSSVYCSQVLIAQSSRCPFHFYAHQKLATERVNNKRSLSASAEGGRQSLKSFVSSLLSTGWLSDRLKWSKTITEEGDQTPLDNNATNNKTWSYNRLFQLESNWNEDSQDWQTKLNRIWNEIIESPPISNHYAGLKEFILRIFLVGDDFTRLRLPVTFRPYTNTRKTLHSAGSYGRVLFRWTDAKFRSSYTGIFSEPTAEAIMSASAGNQFVGNQSAVYGYGFKFPRSNRTSATILSLNAFFGLGAYWNTFGYMTCNHVSLVEMSVLIPTIPGWTNFPNQIGLSNVAAYNLNGEPSKAPRFPYALCFVPNTELTQRVGVPPTLSSLSSIRSQFKLLRPGDRLFNIIAIMHPQVLSQPQLMTNTNYCRHVGEVVALTSFTRSQFADSRLFFQHQPFDDDLLLRPDWIPYMTLRNLVNEGAFAAYRSVYTPPTPRLSDQIIAIQSLAKFIIRLFTRPSLDGLSFLGIADSPSILELLRFYFSQGGPTTGRIVLNYAFPKSGRDFIPEPRLEHPSNSNLWEILNATSDSRIQINTMTRLEERRKTVYQWLINALAEIKLNCGDNSDYYTCDEARRRNPTGHDDLNGNRFGNEWPPNTLHEIIHENVFMESFQRSLLLFSKYLNQRRMSKQETTATASLINQRNVRIHENPVPSLPQLNSISKWWSQFISKQMNRIWQTVSSLPTNVDNVSNNYGVSAEAKVHTTAIESEGIDDLSIVSVFEDERNTPTTKLLPELIGNQSNSFSNEADNIDRHSDPVNKREYNDAQRRMLVSTAARSFQHQLHLFNDPAVVSLFLIDLSSLLTSPFRSFQSLFKFPEQQVDPKLVVMHLLGPVFFTVTRATSNRDALFEQLLSLVLGVSTSVTT